MATTVVAQIEIPEAAQVVELPVCLICGTVGKQAGGGQRLSFKCQGPREAPHKKAAMTLVRYEATAIID